MNTTKKLPFIEVSLDQGSESWHLFRSVGIGASEANVIAGVNKWSTVVELWELKTGLAKKDDTINAAMQHGIDLEPFARDAFVKATGIEMTPLCLISSKHEFIRASLDGINEKKNIVLEIKCPTNASIHMKAMGGQVPSYYYPQLQHQLFVSGAEVVCFWSFTREYGGFMIEVLPDPSYIKELVRREKKFWKHVLAKSEPKLSDFTPMS